MSCDKTISTLGYGFQPCKLPSGHADECSASRMDDHELLECIQQILDGNEWTSDTASEIAEVLSSNGYTVRDIDDTIPDDDPEVDIEN